MRVRRLVPLCSLLGLLAAACSVEAPDGDPFVAEDAGTGDDARRACDAATPCDEDAFCHSDGFCAPLACHSDAPCPTGARCRRDTATSDGQCELRPCDAEPCPDGATCGLDGVCRPNATAWNAALYTCPNGSDCGAPGACTAHDDCPNCDDGRCRARIWCEDAADCFRGQACRDGQCQAETDGPDDEPIAALSAGVVVPTVVLWAGRDTVVPISVAAERGARIVVTATIAHLHAELEGEDEALLDLDWLETPALRAIEVPPAATAQTLALRLRLPVGTASVAVAHEAIDCAGDPLDLAALDLAARADNVEPIERPHHSGALPYRPRTCAGDRDRYRGFASAGDAVRVTGDTGILVDATSTAAVQDSSGRLVFDRDGPIDIEVLGEDATGPYALDLVLHPAARGAACAVADRIELARSAATDHRIELVAAPDLGAPSCFAAADRAAADAIVALVPPPDAKAGDQLLVRAQAAAGDAVLELAWLDACESDDALACVSSLAPRAPAHLTAPADGDAPLWLWVSSATPDATVDLHMEVIAAGDGSNDACESATALTASGTERVLTVGANNDVEVTAGASSACAQAPSLSAGPERFFWVTVDGRDDPVGPARLALRLRPQRWVAPTAAAAVTAGRLWASTDCSDDQTMSERCVRTAFDDEVLVLRPAADAAATTYFVAVDGAAPGGVFELEVVTDPACVDDSECGDGVCSDFACVPLSLEGDSCLGVAPVTVDEDGYFQVEGNLVAASDTVSNLRCGDGGAEQVWQLDMPETAPEALEVWVWSAAGPIALEARRARPGAALDTACVTGARAGCATGDGRSSWPALVIDAPEPRSTYFLVVESSARVSSYVLGGRIRR